MSDSRATLRRELRARRRAIPPAERIAAAEALAGRLFGLPFAPQAGHAGGYWAMDGEIALHAWQLRLPAQFTYCLPVLGPDERLRFAPWRPGEALVANRFGIPEPDVAPTELLEPSAMALVVVPLVGFDPRGHRLGMGAGLYDRHFAFLRHRRAWRRPRLVGVAFEAQKVARLAEAPHDVLLDGIVTERGVYGRIAGG